MDRSEIETVAREIVSLYGPVRPWTEPAALPRIARHFAGYPLTRVIAAVDTWAAEHPDKAPKPAELYAAIRRDHATTGPVDPDDCPHPRPLAIVDETENGRIGMCRICHTEIRFPSGKLLTQTEISDREKARQEARHG